MAKKKQTKEEQIATCIVIVVALALYIGLEEAHLGLIMTFLIVLAALFVVMTIAAFL